MIDGRVTTLDNTEIAISHYEVPKGLAEQTAKAVIVVASATGVPRRFYRHFAKAATAQKFTVYTLDYRGIGDSAPNTLKGYRVDYLDWAKQDLAAVVREAKNAYPELPIFLVGHSYGGHALGLLPNVEDIAGAYVFGTGAGWSGWMPTMEKVKVDILWKLLAPILVRAKGYMAWSALGMGEDLPYGVYKQWKHWCGFPHYFFDDPDMAGIEDVFARYKGLLVAVNATDDKWAQPVSRDAFIKGYTGANKQTIDLNPKDYKLSNIGHMGYFFSSSAALWTPIFDTFDNLLEKQSGRLAS